jgi:predicted small secreted protein
MYNRIKEKYLKGQITAQQVRESVQYNFISDAEALEIIKSMSMFKRWWLSVRKNNNRRFD